jgi:SAM-dependent methyltransferase
LIVRLLKDIEFRARQKRIRSALESGSGPEVFDWYIHDWQNSTEKWDSSMSSVQNQKTDLNRRRFYSSLTKLVSKYDRIVDVGCGNWELLVLKNDPKSVGIDLSRATLRILKRNGFEGEVVLGDCMHLPFKDGIFDFALSNQVVEHLLRVGDVSRSILEMERVSKALAVVTPNAMFHYRINDQTHFLFFTPRSLRRIMGDCEVYGIGQVAGLLSYWFMYERASVLPLVGRLIYETFLHLDRSRLMEGLSKRLWNGDQLIALKENHADSQSLPHAWAPLHKWPKNLSYRLLQLSRTNYLW